jgi:predicted DNA-binding protein
MQIRFKPETESRLNELSAKTGRSPADLIEDAIAGYLAEVAETRNLLASRYDELKSGRVKPIDGEEAFSRLRRKSKGRGSSRS